MSVIWDFKIEIKDNKIFDKIAEQYKVDFPMELKDFIIQNNAASPDKGCVVINGVERVYEATLSFNEDDVEATTFESAMKSIGRFDYLPFAQDPFGNYFCHKISNGTISYYDQDEDTFSDSEYSLEEFIENK